MNVLNVAKMLSKTNVILKQSDVKFSSLLKGKSAPIDTDNLFKKPPEGSDLGEVTKIEAAILVNATKRMIPIIEKNGRFNPLVLGIDHDKGNIDTFTIVDINGNQNWKSTDSILVKKEYHAAITLLSAKMAFKDGSESSMLIGVLISSNTKPISLAWKYKPAFFGGFKILHPAQLYMGDIIGSLPQFSRYTEKIRSASKKIEKVEV